MFKRVLIANRGEIACRIIRTLKRLSIHAIAVYSEADAHAQHCSLADEAVCIGPPESAASYLKIDAIINAAKSTRAEAVHPGYGFLAENADFAKAVRAAGMVFIGPTPEAIQLLGDKVSAKDIARELKVPIAPSLNVGNMNLADQVKEASAFAKKVGFPVLIKAAGGGGGRGMRRVSESSELESALQSASREAESFFGDKRVFIEKLVFPARHVEVQILGDSHGDVIHLFDRDCSFQRQNQKVIEEAPAPNIPDAVRNKMLSSAVALAKRASYSGAGTVEFLYDGKKDFYFLEVNSRLQVEHPVTEMITGLDLVELQLRVACSERISEIVGKELSVNGCAIEVRLCAEDPDSNFVASTGRLLAFTLAPGVQGAGQLRVDTGFGAGDVVSHYYDSMLAKVVSWGPDRETARENLLSSLTHASLFGVKSNLSFLITLLESSSFKAVEHHVTLASTLLADAKQQQESSERYAAVAALGYVLWHSEQQSPGWRAQQGFRIYGSASVSFYLRRDSTTFQTRVQVNAANVYQCTVNESCFEFKVQQFSREIGTWRAIFTEGSRSRSCTFFVSDRTMWVGGEQGSFHFELEFPELRSAAAGDTQKSHSDTVRSPLPGKIVAIKGVTGQSVHAGDILMVIESMKMEHPIKAPHAGTIAEFMVKTGDVIPSAAQLCKIVTS